MTKTTFVNVQLNLDDSLSIKESSVLSYLCSLDKKEYCFASNSHMSDTLKIHDRTLYRILNTLEEKELIKRVTRSTGKYGKSRKIYVTPTVKATYHNNIIHKNK
jgi:DNA-binding MarR family transcriptional regulator